MSGRCLLNNEPDGLREKLIEGRVKGKSWKEIGEEFGTGSPGATRAAFQRLTGSADFKTKGPGIRAVVEGLKEGQEKVVKKAIGEVKVGRVVPDPSPPKMELGKHAPAPRGTPNRSEIWRSVQGHGEMKRVVNDARALIDEVLDIPDMNKTVRVIRRPGRSGTVRGDYHPNTRDIRGNPHQINAPSTFIHEFGHFIDNHAFGFDTAGAIDRNSFSVTSSWASERVGRLPDRVANALQDVMDALDDTQATHNNRRNLAGARRKYVTSKREQFARSFNQYITDKVSRRSSYLSPDHPVKTLAINQHNHVRIDALNSYQWDDSDFGPMVKLFDNLFREVGWLRE